ncbi:MAG: hypothetical protein UV74_C0002G0026 [Candidatus Woesebacteria bacterium GW2011_GWB1_43_14]|uniref:Glycosyltransferase n=1 Tax=Candidatus Woesebacteria bacterium GW2011_GWB1_43_14 TaxID=1618578 RepID=A0A0G1DML9_9BACT|nr:MAG: hypothetical protein UV51_C0004G0073 [Candidatus Woesebacteria bacterium GW2011_GWC1_42_9]KKS98807.1 MAG: hypothetical protein UV74_C0002G0026 [Candidatus Woesebacteria bacterium GW2011_GWB1_43_14]
MIYAVYRCLYGEDFIQESIRSIRDYVDKIFIFWDDKPWGDIESCIYKGEEVKFPKKFDNILDKIQELNDPKVVLIHDHVENNLGQFTHLINDIILKNWQKPDLFIVIEVDHVLKQSEMKRALGHMSSGQIRHATTKPLELWKTYEYRIPERNRLATVFWNMDGLERLPDTGRQANAGQTAVLPVYTHNFGFCFNPQTMYWKHLTALGYAKKIGDRLPNEDWYDKWLNWSINDDNKDLEISKGREHTIPYAYRYDVNELPEAIKDKYKL